MRNKNLKSYFQDLMRDERSDPLSGVLKSGLLLFSIFYAAIIKAHHFFYKARILKTYKAGVPVISVGNITLGGTGKTPFAIMLAGRLAEKYGKKPAVLIRGYGEDEWRLLKERLSAYGVRIFVGRDRIRNAGKAVKNGADSLILDDGFQHRRLERDIDIVLVDSTNPFGNRFLFPRGILRENISGIGRADIVVLTKVDKGQNNVREIEDEIKKTAFRKIIMKTFHKPEKLIDVEKGDVFDISFIKGKTVCAVSAICDSSYFKYTLRKADARVGLEIAFPDHHFYSARDLEHVFRECKKRKIDTIVTTEKDVVKLKGLKIPRDPARMLVLTIALEITDGEKELDAEITRLYMRNTS